MQEKSGRLSPPYGGTDWFSGALMPSKHFSHCVSPEASGSEGVKVEKVNIEGKRCVESVNKGRGVGIHELEIKLEAPRIHYPKCRKWKGKKNDFYLNVHVKDKGSNQKLIERIENKNKWKLWKKIRGGESMLKVVWVDRRGHIWEFHISPPSKNKCD